MLTDTSLIGLLLWLGDGWGAWVEARRLGSVYHEALALVKQGDTNRALLLLKGDTSCAAKRYTLVLYLKTFRLGSAQELVEDGCFSETDRVLVNAYMLDFSSDHPLTDTLEEMLPNLIPPHIPLILNIIPGMGMVYVGSYWKGLKSFLANAVGIGGIVYSVRRRNYLDAFIIYFFWENRFLIGSFHNSLRETWLENRRRLEPYFKYITSRLSGDEVR